MKKGLFLILFSIFLNNFTTFSMSIDPVELLKQAQSLSYKQAKKVNNTSFQKIYKACKKVAEDNKTFMKTINSYKDKFDKLNKQNKDERSEFGKMSVYLSLLYLEAVKVIKKKNKEIFDKEIKKQPTITTDKLFNMGASPLELKQPSDEAASELGISNWNSKTDQIKNESRS